MFRNGEKFYYDMYYINEHLQKNSVFIHELTYYVNNNLKKKRTNKQTKEIKRLSYRLIELCDVSFLIYEFKNERL